MYSNQLNYHTIFFSPPENHCKDMTYFYILQEENANLFAAFSVTAHELIYTTGSIYQFRFARIERMGRTGNFQFNQWISNTIDFYRIFCVHG